MKTLAGIALGFAMMPALIGLISAFAWTSIHFNLSKSDCMIGAAVGLATFMVGATIAFKVA
jgi:hypothetical protein